LKNKVISLDKALEFINDDAVVMYGGFLSCGAAETIIDGMVAKGVKNLTIIGNDTGLVGTGVSKLIATRQVKRVITSHIGTNPETGRLMSTGEMQVDLVPQGTLIERIRSAGHGLGGVLTPTGIGTDVALDKQIINVDGKDYLLEKPLFGDVAILHGSIVDKAGNIFHRGTTRNFNSIIATACKIVIVEAEKLVEVGELEPEYVMTPGIFVDYIVVAGGND